MPVCLAKRDTLSGWQRPRKPGPRLSAQNGMRFPYGMPSGKRVPESRLRVGQAFQLSPSAETASRNKRSNWDAVSAEIPSGNRVPLRASILGCTFRQRVQPETASHSETKFWDAVSG